MNSFGSPPLNSDFSFVAFPLEFFFLFRMVL